jgi:hypothetical protein
MSSANGSSSVKPADSTTTTSEPAIRSLSSHELKVRNAKYLRAHPEIDEMLHDFVVEVLDKEPTNLIEFAVGHFSKESGDVQ